MLLILCLNFFIQAFQTRGEIIPYHQHRIYPSRPEYLIIPKFSKNDAPSWPPGHGHSFIDLTRLRIYSDCGQIIPNCKNNSFELLMFEAPSDQPWMDYWKDHNFCCTTELVSSGDCTAEQENKLIIPSNLPGAFIRTLNIPPDESQTSHEVSFVSHHEITSTGMYVLFMAVCDDSSNPIIIDGHVDSLDPYGYLPADIFGNLPFFGALSVMYTIIGVAWGLTCVFFSDQLLSIQIWISAVMALGMLETTIMFSHYLDWNDHGSPALSITMIGLFFGVSKRALSRVVVMLASLGYGIVRPTLGEDMHRVLLLGGAYFLLSLLYTASLHVPLNSKVADDPEYDLVSSLAFFIGAIDTIFFLWAINSINSLLTTLAARRQASKYLLYRNFRATLFVSLFFTCLWVLYGSVLSLNDSKGVQDDWQDRWTVDALWELTYFVMFVVMAVLWAPSRNSLRYAYSSEVSQLDDDSEWNNIANREAVERKGEKEGEAGVELTVGFHDARAEKDLDDEYGGSLRDEADPFQGGGALDPSMAISKRA